jgi:hypothetical protein
VLGLFNSVGSEIVRGREVKSEVESCALSDMIEFIQFVSESNTLIGTFQMAQSMIP